MRLADSVLRADELEPGDEINLWDVSWDMRKYLPNVWNWSKGDERHRAMRQPARVKKVVHADHNVLIMFENFPDWVIPSELEIRVRTHDKEQAS